MPIAELLPAEDGYVSKQGTSYGRTKTGYYISFYRTTPAKSSSIYRRGYVEFDISSIPDNAVIDSVVLYYFGYRRVDTYTRYIRPMAFRPSISSDQTVYNDVGDGTPYYSAQGFPELVSGAAVGDWLHPWSVDPKTDLQARLVDDWFAFGFQGVESSDDKYADIYSIEYCINLPLLEVHYTIPSVKGILVQII